MYPLKNTHLVFVYLTISVIDFKSTCRHFGEEHSEMFLGSVTIDYIIVYSGLMSYDFSQPYTWISTLTWSRLRISCVLPKK